MSVPGTNDPMAMLWEWMRHVLQPYFGDDISPDDLYPFLDENFCLFVPPKRDDIFVIVSLQAIC